MLSSPLARLRGLVFSAVYRRLSLRGRLAASSALPPVEKPNVNFAAHVLHRVDRYPDHIALIDGLSGARHTYAQVRQASSQVASGLIRRGIGRGSSVCLFLPNCPEWVLAMYGAVRCGATVVPSNPAYTALELGHPLRHVRPAMVITSADLVDTVRQAAREAQCEPVVVLVGASDAESSRLGCVPFDALLEDDGTAMGSDFAPVDADSDVAFICYSSGTTGPPKGVMLSHNNVAVNMRQTQAIMDNVECHDRVLGVLPLFHIYGVAVSSATTLYTGGTLVILPKFDPATYLGAIEQYRATVLHTVTPIVKFLVQHPMVAEFDLSSVERILSGGAPMGAELEAACLTKFRANKSELQLLQAYGMTETILLHMSPRRYLIPTNDLKAGSVGVLAPSTECRIVDPVTRQDVEEGAAGELLIRGPQVMLGYFNDPAATTQCLDADGWLTTGDIGYRDSDGFYFITDRVKELIKFKGSQVAPAELEDFLCAHPNISDCGVVGRPDDRHGELPTAFVARNGGISEEDVQNLISRNFSDHKKLRGGVFFVDAIPRSPSGKILRRQLRDKLKSG